MELSQNVGSEHASVCLLAAVVVVGIHVNWVETYKQGEVTYSELPGPLK